MVLFDKFAGTDINKEVEKFRKISGAILIDVRSEEDYKKGHIPGSVNMPESNLEVFESFDVAHNTPIFVYCLSGAKSWNVVNKLKALGFTKVNNIGGINKYTGDIESSLN